MRNNSESIAKMRAGKNLLSRSLRLPLIWLAGLLLMGFSILLPGTNSVKAWPGGNEGATPQLATALQSVKLEYNQIDASGFTQIVSFVTVSDDSGLTIGGLTKDNFEVREDSVRELPIDVVEISNAAEGVTVALVLDRSGSMQGQPIQDAKTAASGFVQLLQDQDQAALVSFNNFVTTDQGFTSDKNALTAAIQALQAFGGTAIYDAVIQAADLIEPQEGRKAIILLTDGKDTNSKNSFQTALNRAKEINVPVFTIGLALSPGSPEENVLITLANDTGGRYFRSASSSDLQAIYSAIAALLFQQYRITYTTHNPTTDGSLRHVKIDVQYQGFASYDTASYRAPDHVVTIAATTTDQVNPGRTFTINLEIPPSSKFLFHKMKNLHAILQYDPTYLKVKQTFDQNIDAGALFGADTEHTLTFNVDEANGVITLDLTKDPNSGLIEGRGQLAAITFEAAADLPDSTRLQFDIIDHLASDINDWPIATRVENLTLYSYGNIVWPGDTNENGKVELTDVTVLGVYWNIDGDGRPTEPDPLRWKSQLAGHYPVRVAAHADADGNGNVSEQDLIPIGLNWGKTTDSPDTTTQPVLLPKSQPQGTLSLAVSSTGESGVYTVKLRYESSQPEQLCGAMLRLRYPKGQLEIAQVQPGKDWPGQPLFISSNDQARALLAAGVMLTAGSPLLRGSGEIAQFVVHSDSEPDLQELIFEKVGVVTPDGTLHELTVENASNSSDQAAKSFVLFPAYPNPFNPATRLRFALPEAGEVEVHIYNVTGRLVVKSERQSFEAGEHSWGWDGRDQNGSSVSSGIYFVRVLATTPDGKKWSSQQKITMMK
ncbi:MAG: VWA domain-containing protein [bacterium]